MLPKANDVMTMKLIYMSAFGTKTLPEALLESCGMNVTLIGSIGVGKTVVMRTVAQSMNMPLVKVTARGINPMYLGGIPIRSNDGEQISLHIPAPFNSLFRNSEQVVLLDEFNHASPEVSALLISILQEHMLHEYTVSPRTLFVIACNPPEISSVKSTIPAPILNRTTTVEFVFTPNPQYNPLNPQSFMRLPTFDEVSPLFNEAILLKYIRLYQTFLNNYSSAIIKSADEFLQVAASYRERGESHIIVGTPRSYQRLFVLLSLSEMLKDILGSDEEFTEVVIRGNTHPEGASQVMAFLRHFRDIQFVEQIKNLLNVPDEQISKNMSQLTGITRQLNGDQLYFVSFTLLNDAQLAVRWAKVLFEIRNEPLGMFVIMNMPKGLDLVTRLSKLGLGHIISRIVS